MGTSTIITGTGVSAVTTTCITVKDDGTFDTQARNTMLGTLVSTSATAIAGHTLNVRGTKEVYQKYAQAYVESMSDEELERALTQMNLLIDEEKEINGVKTL